MFSLFPLVYTIKGSIEIFFRNIIDEIYKIFKVRFIVKGFTLIVDDLYIMKQGEHIQQPIVLIRIVFSVVFLEVN